MRNAQPFMPATHVPSSTIAVTSGTGATPVALGVQCNSVFLANVGSKACFIKFGDSTVTAAPPTSAAATETKGDMCLPASFVGVLGTNGQSYIAAVSVSTETTTLRITPGEGFL